MIWLKHFANKFGYSHSYEGVMADLSFLCVTFLPQNVSCPCPSSLATLVFSYLRIYHQSDWIFYGPGNSNSNSNVALIYGSALITSRSPTFRLNVLCSIFRVFISSNCISPPQLFLCSGRADFCHCYFSTLSLCCLLRIFIFIFISPMYRLWGQPYSKCE